MRATLLLAVACVGGCTANVVGGHVPPPPHTQVMQSGPCAVEGVTGALPGVTLAIRSANCVYPVGQPATFTYEVKTDATVPPIHVPAFGGCGSCTQHSTDPLSWIGWGIGGASDSGTSQQYCLCDVGCCPPDLEQTIQPIATTESGVIAWSGRTWSGPSDTGNQEGPFFATGLYAVSVVFSGGDTGSVEARLPIEIIDP